MVGHVTNTLQFTTCKHIVETISGVTGMSGERVKRRLAAIMAAEVVGFSRLMEANDEWQLQHRYLSIEAFAGVSTIEEEVDRFALAPPVATPILTPRAA